MGRNANLGGWQPSVGSRWNSKDGGEFWENISPPLLNLGLRRFTVGVIMGIVRYMCVSGLLENGVIPNTTHRNVFVETCLSLINDPEGIHYIFS